MAQSITDRILANEIAARVLYVVAETHKGTHTGMYKVGITRGMHSLGKRISDMQCGNPRKLEVFFTREFINDGEAFSVEQSTHKAFKFNNYGLANKEWLDLDASELGNVIAFIGGA